MKQTVIDWQVVIQKILKTDGIWLTQLADEILIDFSWLQSLSIQRTMTNEPSHGDGERLILRYCMVTKETVLPVRELPDQMTCSACCLKKPTETIIRRKNGLLRCVPCTKKSRRANDLRYRQNKKGVLNATA